MYSTFSSSDGQQQIHRVPRNEQSGGIHWCFGSLILINTLVGAGILNLPYTFRVVGGLIPAMGVQLVMVPLIWASISGMVWASHRKRTTLYQDTVYEYLGFVGQILCACLMLIDCYLSSIAYLIAIKDQLSTGTTLIFPTALNHWYMSGDLHVVLLAVVIIYPWCLIKSIDRLYKISAVATITIILVCIVVVYEYFHLAPNVAVSLAAPPRQLSNIFLTIPGIVVAYMFDLASVAVYGRLANRSIERYLKASGLALIVIFCLYNIVAGFAYATFGDDIQSNFMLNYAASRDKQKWIISFAEVAYCFKLCLEYPIMQFLGCVHEMNPYDVDWSHNVNRQRGMRVWSSYFSMTTIRSIVRGMRWWRRGRGVDESLIDDSDRVWWHDDRWWTSALWIGSTVAIAIGAPTINSVLPLISAGDLHFQFTVPGLVVYLANTENYREATVTRRCFLAVRCVSIVFMVIGCVLSGIVLFQYFYIRS